MTILICAYATFAALIALSALAALVRVPGTGGVMGLPSFVLSAPALHAAPLLIWVLAILSAVALALGGLENQCGQVGLVLSVVAALLLAMTERRAAATASTLQTALEEVFGSDYRSRVARGRAVMNPQRRWGINPRVATPANVERIPNLSYGNAGVRNLLDVYRPREARSGLPVLLAVHGGAWVMGNKEMQSKEILLRMASNGWLVVAISYRLGPDARFPDFLVDVKKAIAWIRTHAAEYGGDPDFIVACGESAGGHLATLAGLTANRSDYQPGFEAIDTSLRGVIPIYGRMDFVDRYHVADHAGMRQFLEEKVMPCRYEENPKLWDEASPVACVHPDMPPTFVVHGTHDSLIPVREAELFVRDARAVSRAPVAFAPLRGAQHAFDLASSRWTHPTVEAMHAFGELLFAQYTAGQERSSMPLP
jgi:acetyl esterase/lipase